MILTCPVCSTRYSADAKNFPPEGRDVRCAKCGHIWHHMAPAEDPDASIFEGGPPEEPTETIDEIRQRQEAALEERSHRFGPANFGSSPEDDLVGPRPWQLALARAIVGVGWIGIVVVILALGWAALIYRPQLIEYWPQSASLYASIGIKPDLAVLKFSDVGYRSTIEDGQPMLTVSGRLVNDGAKEMSVPVIRAVLIDDAHREVYHWTFSPKQLTLPPGQSTKFASRIASPPSAARHLELHFAKTTE